MVWVCLGSGGVSGITAMILGTGVVIVVIAGAYDSMGGNRSVKGSCEVRVVCIGLIGMGNGSDRWNVGYSAGDIGVITGVDGNLCWMEFMLLSIWWIVVGYAVWYSWGSTGVERLLVLLTLFVLGMETIMVGSGVVELFVGWEIIGVVSMYLIGYYRDRVEAVLSGVKALVYNRLGDVGMLVGLVGGIGWYGCGSMSVWSMLVGSSGNVGWVDNMGLLVMFGFVMGCWCKSALIGLHSWLLDAMEGPTPVSALLHSATLVCAGIVVMAKCEGVWSMIVGGGTGLVLLGCCSSLMACMVG